MEVSHQNKVIENANAILIGRLITSCSIRLLTHHKWHKAALSSFRRAPMQAAAAHIRQRCVQFDVQPPEKEKDPPRGGSFHAAWFGPGPVLREREPFPASALGICFRLNA
jgi:hypothetical protein